MQNQVVVGYTVAPLCSLASRKRSWLGGLRPCPRVDGKFTVDVAMTPRLPKVWEMFNQRRLFDVRGFGVVTTNLQGVNDATLSPSL